MPQINKQNWYQTQGSPEPEQPSSGWYAEGRDGPQAPGPEKKARRGAGYKVLAIVALVLALATLGLTISNIFFSGRTGDVASSPTESDGWSAGSGTLPDDMYDFFSSYYTSSSEVKIPKTAAEEGVTLSFAAAGSQELSLQDIYAAVSPAVVGITTYVGGLEYSWGTGVVFHSDGYIVTNEHVLETAESAIVTFSDGTEYEAAFVGGDAATDLAVLKIDAHDLVCAEFADSAACRVGDAVAAIGNPLGREYAGTMTDGIISAIDRNVSTNGHTMTLLQTNTALNEGNSGGPLLNAYGQVIGITNMKIMSYYTSVEGIGFAIPTSVLKSTVDELLAYGAVSGEPTIGITAGSVPQQAMTQYDLPEGIYISGVEEASDAWTQGIREGDVVTAVNGIAVSTVAEVNAIKEGLGVGDIITLTVYRDGKTFDVDVRLVDNITLQ